MPEKKLLLQYKLRAQIDQISNLAEAIKNALNFYPELIFSVNLCLEEIITNTIFYGLMDVQESEIEVFIYINQQSYLEIFIEDKAPAFNPFLSVKQPDISATIENSLTAQQAIIFFKTGNYMSLHFEIVDIQAAQKIMLSGRLDSNISNLFEKDLLSIFEVAGSLVLIDFSKLNYISSAGIRVILMAAKKSETGKRQINVVRYATECQVGI